MAVEEIDNLLIGASFLLLPFVRWHDIMSRIVFWIFVTRFVVPVVEFVAIAAIYGFDRQNRFK